MARQDTERVKDIFDGVARRPRVLGCQEFEKAIQVAARPLREDYLRHRFARSLGARLPAMRAA